jgi:hypothetical protein
MREAESVLQSAVVLAGKEPNPPRPSGGDVTTVLPSPCDLAGLAGTIDRLLARASVPQRKELYLTQKYCIVNSNTSM